MQLLTCVVSLAVRLLTSTAAETRQSVADKEV